MNRIRSAVVLGAVIAALGLVGCSNRPSAEELQRLEALKAEVTSLERQIASLESDRSSFNKAIADKDSKINRCAQDKIIVEQRIRAMQ